MMSEENEVSLVMKSDDASAFELGVVWKQGGQHSSHGMPQSGVKVVQDNFRQMVSGFPASLKEIASSQ